MGEIERVVLSLSAGKLCKDVLPPKQLSQTLHNIERQLPGNYSMVNDPWAKKGLMIFRPLSHWQKIVK